MKTFCQLACRYSSTQFSYSGAVYSRYTGAIDDHTNRALVIKGAIQILEHKMQIYNQ